MLLNERRVGNCFHHSDLLRRDVPVEALTLQPGETVAARWVTLPELEALVAQPTGARPAGKGLPWVLEKLRALAAEA